MNVFSTKYPSLRYESWTEFKKFIDGTYSRIAFFWSDKNNIYTIVTEELGGVSKEITIFKDGNSDQLDFEANFKDLAPREIGTFKSGLDGYGRQIVVGAGIEGNPVLIGGTDNVSVQAILTDSQGRIITAPPSASSSLAGFSFGDTVLTAPIISPVRRSTYTEQTVNFQGSIVSSSILDTSAGTGARAVKVTYYDQTGDGPFTETATLSGIIPVNFANTNHSFIEKIEVITVGSGGSNAGIITLKSGLAGGGVTIGTISIGDNRTFWAHHYVPINKTCFITGISVGSTAAAAGAGSLFVIKSIALNIANVVEDQISDFITLFGQSSMITRNYNTPIQVTGPARILVYVTTLSGATITYRAAFDYYEQ